MSFARLHVIANDSVAARPDFVAECRALMDACGSGIAVHLRVKKWSARAMLDAARALAECARASGSRAIVNERVDVACAAGADGVHIGHDALTVEDAIAAMSRMTSRGEDRLIVGASAHSVAEARDAVAAGADYLFLGTIWASASHPGGATAGVALIRGCAAVLERPLFAIGGVTTERVREAMLAGASGAAVIRGVWNAARPAQAAQDYLEAMQAAS